MLVAFKDGHHAFFLFGFSKNQRPNISGRELKALRRLAKELLSLDDALLEKAIVARELVEVRIDEG